MQKNVKNEFEYDFFNNKLKMLETEHTNLIFTTEDFKSNFPYSFNILNLMPSFILLEKGGKKEKKGIFMLDLNLLTKMHNSYKSIKGGYRVIFLLQSMSYRIDEVLVEDERAIILDIGYSHYIIVRIPDDVGFKVEKRKLTISSHDRQWLKNFVRFFTKLRKINSYTGKGIILKDQKVEIKPGKKRQ